MVADKVCAGRDGLVEGLNILASLHDAAASPRVRPAPAASLDVVAPGTGEARALVVHTDVEALIPSQLLHAVPHQAVAEPAPLEPEYLGRRRADLQPPDKCRAATLDRDRGLL